MNGRSRDVATPAERGHDLRSEGSDPVPKDRRHDIERVTDHDAPPRDRCVHCGASGSIGSVNPYAECPERRREGEHADADHEPETMPAP
jgi:hypothetical protein